METLIRISRLIDAWLAAHVLLHVLVAVPVAVLIVVLYATEGQIVSWGLRATGRRVRRSRRLLSLLDELRFAGALVVAVVLILCALPIDGLRMAVTVVRRRIARIPSLVRIMKKRPGAAATTHATGAGVCGAGLCAKITKAPGVKVMPIPMTGPVDHTPRTFPQRKSVAPPRTNQHTDAQKSQPRDEQIDQWGHQHAE